MSSLVDNFLFFLSQRTMFCIPFPVDAFDAFNVLLLGDYFYLISFFGVAMMGGNVSPGVWLALPWIREPRNGWLMEELS